MYEEKRKALGKKDERNLNSMGKMEMERYGEETQ